MEPTQEQKEDRLISIGEAARILYKSVETLRRWEKKGFVKAIRPTPGADRMFKLSEIEKIKEQGVA